MIHDGPKRWKDARPVAAETGPAVRRRRSTAAASDVRCGRCGRDRWVIVDDGPEICRPCLMAWVWLANAVGTGETIAEPGLAAMRHAEHVRPRSGCPLCAAGRATRHLGPLDDGTRPY